MRCGCPNCGCYMVQHEQGLESGCICPACLFTCHDCMGTQQAPAALDELAFHAMLRARMRSEDHSAWQDDSAWQDEPR